jgi:hypothetical protein
MVWAGNSPCFLPLSSLAICPLVLPVFELTAHALHWFAFAQYEIVFHLPKIALVKLPIAIQYSLSHSSLTLALVGLLAGSFFAAFGGSEHSNCYSMRNWGGFATLDCKCWSKDCSWKDSCSIPYNLLALDL